MKRVRVFACVQKFTLNPPPTNRRGRGQCRSIHGGGKLTQAGGSNLMSSIAHLWNRPSRTTVRLRGLTSQVGLSLLVGGGCCASFASILTPASLYLPLRALAGLPSGNVVANLGDMTMGEKATPDAERRQIRRQATTGHFCLCGCARARVVAEHVRADTMHDSLHANKFYLH